MTTDNPVQEQAEEKMASQNLKISGGQRLLEAAIVTSTLLSLYLLLALYSFNIADSGWTQTAVSGTASNWMGHTGTYLADV